MCPSAPAGTTHLSDDITSVYCLPHLNTDLGKVGIEGLKSVSVIDDRPFGITLAIRPTRKDNLPRVRRQNRTTALVRDIDAAVVPHIPLRKVSGSRPHELPRRRNHARIGGLYSSKTRF